MIARTASALSERTATPFAWAEGASIGKHLTPCFGCCRMLNITASDIRSYVEGTSTMNVGTQELLTDVEFLDAATRSGQELVTDEVVLTHNCSCGVIGQAVMSPCLRVRHRSRERGCGVQHYRCSRDLRSGERLRVFVDRDFSWRARKPIAADHAGERHTVLWSNRSSVPS